MKGDFSRFTFERDKQYSGVFMQQGRVQLDSDWNEAVDIDTYHREMALHDLVGPCGAPAHNPGFEVLVRQGLNFDGKNDCVHCGTLTDLSFAGDRAFTIEAWLRPRTGSQLQPPSQSQPGGVIAGRFNTGGRLADVEYLLAVNPDGALKFQWIEELEDDIVIIEKSWCGTVIRIIEEEKIVWRELTTLGALPFDGYSHVAVTVDRREVRIYINGRLAGKTFTGNFVALPEGCFLIGGRLEGKKLLDVFNGVIDQLVVWDRGFTDEEIHDRMYTSLRGDEPRLLRLFRFEKEGIGDRLIDSSPNHRYGILGAGLRENSPTWEPPVPWIGKGRCYVQGVLCENPGDVPFTQQASYPAAAPVRPGLYRFYLDVWKRHITALEDPDIRESALGGPDTATRLQTISQVKVIPEDEAHAFFSARESSGRMKARLHQPGMVIENRLYRVEIHGGGGMAGAPVTQIHHPVMEVEYLDPETNTLTVRVWRGGDHGWPPGQGVELLGVEREDWERGIIRHLTMVTASDPDARTVTLETLPPEIAAARGLRLRPVATFKWSRENGTVVFPIRQAEGAGLVVADHNSFGNLLKEGDRVEIVDDYTVLQGKIAPLYRIEKIQWTPDREIMVTLDRPPAPGTAKDAGKHPLMRVWNQAAAASGGGDPDEGTVGGVIPLRGGEWIDLEDGIQVYFDGGGMYHSGDYWWMPARGLSREILWPDHDGEPLSQPPHGIRHYYASLAVVEVGEGFMKVLEDLRKIFDPMITHVRRLRRRPSLQPPEGGAAPPSTYGGREFIKGAAPPSQEVEIDSVK